MFIMLLEFVGFVGLEPYGLNKHDKHNKHYYRETRTCNL